MKCGVGVYHVLMFVVYLVLLNLFFCLAYVCVLLGCSAFCLSCGYVGCLCCM